MILCEASLNRCINACFFSRVTYITHIHHERPRRGPSLHSAIFIYKSNSIDPQSIPVKHQVDFPVTKKSVFLITHVSILLNRHVILPVLCNIGHPIPFPITDEQRLSQSQSTVLRHVSSTKAPSGAEIPIEDVAALFSSKLQFLDFIQVPKITLLVEGHGCSSHSSFVGLETHNITTLNAISTPSCTSTR